jgi:hydrogenase expression/formation protein HypC
MCLTIPGRVVQINGAMAEVNVEGRTDWYNALAQPDVKVGDFVLTHANLIVGIISEEEAQRMLQAAREMQELIDQEDGSAQAAGDEGEGESGSP